MASALGLDGAVRRTPLTVHAALHNVGAVAPILSLFPAVEVANVIDCNQKL